MADGPAGGRGWPRMPASEEKSRWASCSLTTACAGVGRKPVTTASMPRIERVPVAYSCSNHQPSFFSFSR